MWHSQESVPPELGAQLHWSEGGTGTPGIRVGSPQNWSLSAVSQLLHPTGSHITPFLGLTALTLSLQAHWLDTYADKGSDFSILSALGGKRIPGLASHWLLLHIRLQCEPTGVS